MVYFRKLPHKCKKKSCRYLLNKLNYSQFCPKFRCHENGGRSEENAIGSIWRLIPITPIRKKSCRNILHKPSYSQFCPIFVSVGNCDWQHSIAHPRKTRCKCKNLAKFPYTSRVIAIVSQITLPWQRGGQPGINVNVTVN